MDENNKFRMKLGIIGAEDIKHIALINYITENGIDVVPMPQLEAPTYIPFKAAPIIDFMEAKFENNLPTVRISKYRNAKLLKKAKRR